MECEVKHSLGPVVALMITFVLIPLTGCASLKESSIWPAYERTFCYPRISHHRAIKKTTVGVRCRFSVWNVSPRYAALDLINDK